MKSASSIRAIIYLIPWLPVVMLVLKIIEIVRKFEAQIYQKILESGMVKISILASLGILGIIFQLLARDIKKPTRRTLYRAEAYLLYLSSILFLIGVSLLRSDQGWLILDLLLANILIAAGLVVFSKATDAGSISS